MFSKCLARGLMVLAVPEMLLQLEATQEEKTHQLNCLLAPHN